MPSVADGRRPSQNPLRFNWPAFVHLLISLPFQALIAIGMSYIKTGDLDPLRAFMGFLCSIGIIFCLTLVFGFPFGRLLTREDK